MVEVTEDTMDPKVWGQNWPLEYDSYLKTSLPTTTKYGGRGLGASDGGPAEQKLDREPWLRRIFAGYAFAIDYRDRRGHAYALFDQEQTRRVTEKQQPGACLQCHASNLALYRFVGKGDVMKGFEKVSAMPYSEARNMKDDKGQLLVEHPLACVDCHEPKTMALRVTRPGFIAGIKALKAKQGVADYDPNRDATRQEMRSFVCGQCHVEYYFKGEGKVVTYPWANGSRSRRSRRTTTTRASPTGRTPRPAPRCSRRSTPSSRCGTRASTRAPAWRARTATCPTSGRGRSR